MNVFRSRTAHVPKRRSSAASWTTLSIYDRPAPRPTTEFELFFDLVFVAAVSGLGALLEDDHSLIGGITFLLLLAAVWWAWISFSYFADLFGDKGFLSRAALLAAMLGACVIAVTVRDGVSDDSSWFAGTFAILFLMLAALYLVAHRSLPSFRRFCRCYLAGSLTGASCWLASLAVPPPARYWIWPLGVLVNMILSGPLAYLPGRAYPKQTSHMPERFSSFTLIVLGESVVAVVIGLDPKLGGASAAAAGAGFVIATAIWSVYFSRYDADAINDALGQRGLANVKTFIYGYGHLVLYAAILATGIAVALAIKDGEAIPLLGISTAGVIAGFLTIWAPSGRYGPLEMILSMIALATGAVIISVGWASTVTAMITVAAGWAWLAILAASAGDRRRRPVSREPG